MRLLIFVCLIYRAYEWRKKRWTTSSDPLSHAFRLSLDFIVRLSFSRIFEWTRRHVWGAANGAIYEVELEYCPWDVYGFNSPLALLGHDKRSSWSRQVRTRHWKGNRGEKKMMNAPFFLYCSFCVLFPFILPRFFSSNLLLTKHPRHKVLSTVCDIHSVCVIREV